MINKLMFNNMVISNKKAIQQSRLQIINKLVHKIRRLKDLSEKYPDNVKFNERIRKSIDTLDILKKLKSFDIIKKILLMDRAATAVIGNAKSIPEEVAVALLSLNKIMQSLIKRFRTELQLSESGIDDWKQVLIESSKRKQKIERTEEKRRQRMDLKQQKLIERKRLVWLETNQQSENISGHFDSNASTTGGWQIEELVIDNNETIIPNKKQKVSERTESKTVANEKCVDSHQDESVNNTTKDCSETLEVDPFFITDTGENYMSSATNTKNENNQEETSQKHELNLVKLNNYKNPAAFRNCRQKARDDNQQNLQHINDHWASDRVKKFKVKNKQTFETHGKMHKNKSTAKVSDENDIHPSWVAKQKLKPIITAFKGKKIKFGQEECSNLNKVLNLDIKTNNLNSKQNTCVNSLHPSWAAKQRLKPSIQAFQGKKIKFDNSDE